MDRNVNIVADLNGEKIVLIIRFALPVYDDKSGEVCRSMS